MSIFTEIKELFPERIIFDCSYGVGRVILRPDFVLSDILISQLYNLKKRFEIKSVNNKINILIYLSDE